MSLDENKLDEIYDSIHADEELVKTASAEEINIDELVGELRKTASAIEADIYEEEELTKEANEDDVKEFDQKAVKGKVTLESSNPAKQRLKEIAMEGAKLGDEYNSDSFSKLKSIALTKKASAELVEELSDRIAEQYLKGV